MSPTYSTVQHSTVQYSTVQYSTAQYSTVQHSTVQYSTVQYSTVQYSTVQYSTAPHRVLMTDQPRCEHYHVTGVGLSAAQHQPQRLDPAPRTRHLPQI